MDSLVLLASIMGVVATSQAHIDRVDESASKFRGTHSDVNAIHHQAPVSPWSIASFSPMRADSIQASIPLIDVSLRYGVDTTVAPCVDFYAYANGGWRTVVASANSSSRAPDRNLFADTYDRTTVRLQRLLDSSLVVANTTTDPTLRVIAVYYESCLTATMLEQTRMRPFKRDSADRRRDSTRAQQCTNRTITNLSGAIGQTFAVDLLAGNALVRMNSLLKAIHAAAIEQIKKNPRLTQAEKSFALKRLAKLHLRVGLPNERIDYRPLVLSPTDYHGNKTLIANFLNQSWLSTIGSNTREQWKASLLMPNAFYQGSDHAIEIPAVMFMEPFFSRNYDDELNFAAIGYIVGHEIFHSIAGQLPTVTHADMKVQMDRLKAIYSAMAAIDGWKPNGDRTFSEDVADIGGVRVAYNAWKSIKRSTSKATSEALRDGYTPDQRFFMALARVWRATWTANANAYNSDSHSPHFARVNGMVMSMPEFGRAFGCKDSDPMVLPADRRAAIW